MDRETKNEIRRLNRSLHRDLGYFASSLLIAYCLSGLALNHVDAWDPDFRIERRTLVVPDELLAGEVDADHVAALSRWAGEERHRVYDMPTPDQVKVYYEHSTLHVNRKRGVAVHETVSRRPLFYEVNVLHRNGYKPWKWAADLFAIVLILINATGLFILRGRHGMGGRGKWFIAAGVAPPLVALLLHG